MQLKSLKVPQHQFISNLHVSIIIIKIHKRIFILHRILEKLSCNSHCNQYVVKDLPVDQLWEGKSIIADISSLLYDK